MAQFGWLENWWGGFALHCSHYVLSVSFDCKIAWNNDPTCQSGKYMIYCGNTRLSGVLYRAKIDP
jgi:hypothetical protein